MATVAQPQRIAGRTARSRRARAAASPAERKRRLLGGGVLWIVVIAVLLGGVVAVNVAVLQLNLQLDGAAREREQLRADLAGLRAELSGVAATEQIERAARDELGLVPADPDEMIYVTLPPK
jgi:cell division protein FtsL